MAVDAEMTDLAGECMSAYDCIGPRRLTVVLSAAQLAVLDTLPDSLHMLEFVEAVEELAVVGIVAVDIFVEHPVETEKLMVGILNTGHSLDLSGLNVQEGQAKVAQKIVCSRFLRSFLSVDLARRILILAHLKVQVQHLAA